MSDTLRERSLNFFAERADHALYHGTEMLREAQEMRLTGDPLDDMRLQCRAEAMIDDMLADYNSRLLRVGYELERAK